MLTVHVDMQGVGGGPGEVGVGDRAGQLAVQVNSAKSIQCMYKKKIFVP